MDPPRGHVSRSSHQMCRVAAIRLTAGTAPRRPAVAIACYGSLRLAPRGTTGAAQSVAAVEREGTANMGDRHTRQIHPPESDARRAANRLASRYDQQTRPSRARRTPRRRARAQDTAWARVPARSLCAGGNHAAAVTALVLCSESGSGPDHLKSGVLRGLARPRTVHRVEPPRRAQ